GELDSDRLAGTLGRFDLAAEAFVLGERIGLARAPAGALRLELRALPREPLATLRDVADPLLEPADLERHLTERALRRVQRVVGVVVRLPDLLELRFRAAQLRGPRLERGDRRDDGLADARFLARRVAVAQEPELVELGLRVVLQRAVAARDLGLRLELVEVAGQLAQDVL